MTFYRQEIQGISSHSNFLFFVLSKSPNQMRDRLPLNTYLCIPCAEVTMHLAAFVEQLAFLQTFFFAISRAGLSVRCVP